VCQPGIPDECHYGVPDCNPVNGRMLPTTGKAVWHPEGEPEIVYAEIRFLPESLVWYML